MRGLAVLEPIGAIGRESKAGGRGLAPGRFLNRMTDSPIGRDEGVSSLFLPARVPFLIDWFPE
jgi:hypothetical protein